MADRPQGRFVTIEGVEGSGKTTQVEPACRPSAPRRARGGDHPRAGRHTYQRPHSRRRIGPKNVEIHPHTEALLMCAARAQLVHEVIRPALARGAVVLCDRYSDSTFAYQGYARGQDLATLRSINAFATGGLLPDLTILLDLPVEDGLQRRFGASGDGSTNRMDSLDLDFHRRVAAGYHALAQADPDRWRVVDASLGEEDVDAAIWEIIAGLLNLS